MKRKKRILIYIGILIILIIIVLIIVFMQKKNIKEQKYNISSLITNNNICLKKNNICDSGTLLELRVNNTETESFYIINDDGFNLTLIMNRNIINNISWSSNDTSCSNGPENLINSIKELTKSWNNIKEKDYTITDNNNCYNNIVEKIKARIPTIEDVNKLGCEYFNENTCPEFLISNLDSSSGYWLSTSNKPIDSSSAYVVYKNRNLSTPWVITNNYYGLRLIIEVEK